VSVSPGSAFDLVIIGAGPCGSVLGYELAKRGLRVLLLEKERLPRDKTCAGGVTVRAQSLIPFDFSDCVEDTIFGVRLSFKTRPRKTRRYHQPLAYMVSRDIFDAYLLEKARALGASVQEGCQVWSVKPSPGKVEIVTDRKTFTTPALVAADGANSAVVRSLGWRTNFEYGLGVNGNLAADSAKLGEWRGLMGLDYGVPGGYAWVFPKREYFAVGAGGSFRVGRSLKPRSLALARAYGLGRLAPGAFKGHLMPVRRAGAPVSSGRIALVGDAAGLIDPLTGEGLFYGLKSCYLLLPFLLDLLRGKIGDLAGYDRNLRSELGEELRIARTIQKLNSLTPRIFFSLLQNNDRVWRAFCRMLRGEKTYSQIRAFLPSPLRGIFDLI
jgi:geranylgeranyl reductase family protein